MSNYILYIVTIILAIISFKKDKKKTKMALRKGWKSLENILPQFLGIIMIVGVLLSIFTTDTISKVIGSNSGILGVLISAIVGSVTLIPGFVAFPTAALLLKGGAGVMQVAAFVSTLMMVGVVTIPIEIKYFNKKLTILRNVFAFLFSILVAFIIGKVVGC